MILNCNSCDKKFVVPDNAISASGRMVQCGSCGNKWKQFPLSKTEQIKSAPMPRKISPKIQKISQKIQKPKKTKKIISRKPREINLYSPEYLAKKHGIKLTDNIKPTTTKSKVSFGFYNSLLLLLVIIIIISRGLYFFQDFIVQKLPFTEFYINYFFESIKNMFELWKDLISSY